LHLRRIDLDRYLSRFSSIARPPGHYLDIARNGQLSAPAISTSCRPDFDRKGRSAIGGEHRALDQIRSGGLRNTTPIGKYAGGVFPVFASINRPDWRDGAVNTGNAMRLYLAALALMAQGCTEDEGLAAEKKFQMVKRNGTPEEICAAYRAVSDVYLEQKNDEKYDDWYQRGSQYCLNVRLSRNIGMEPSPPID
jgi:hypothetical protein